VRLKPGWIHIRFDLNSQINKYPILYRLDPRLLNHWTHIIIRWCSIVGGVIFIDPLVNYNKWD
jgi:hypothetical protein